MSKEDSGIQYEIDNLGVKLSTQDFDDSLDAIIRDVLRTTDNNPDRASAMCQRLASMNWHQIVNEKVQAMLARAREVRERMQETFEYGGGKCADCEGDYRRLYCWPYSNKYKSIYGTACCYSEYDRLCRKCLFKRIKDFSIPFQEQFSLCDNCRRLAPDRSMYKINDYSAIYKQSSRDIFGRCKGLYCLLCVEQVTEMQFITCKVCRRKTTNYKKDCDTCNDCRVSAGTSISLHLKRARDAGTPATLTAREWATTLEYFNEMCAYCMVRPYGVLEHFVPIASGGGTTADNCVPACSTCNSWKGCMHPDELCKSDFSKFSTHAINHIRQYLTSDRQGVNLFAVRSGRDLVVI